MRDKNPGYPDDIRSYDNDPRSPFFKDQIIQCVICGEPISPDEDAIDLFPGWQHPSCREDQNKEKIS